MELPLWLKAALLGVVEGLTEFLPVSSTGHMMLVGKAIRFDVEVFEVFIQLGALAAVWWIYRHRILRMARGALGLDPADCRLAMNVILAFLPAAAIGFLCHRWIKAHLFSSASIAWAMIAGGVAILAVESLKLRVRSRTLEEVSVWQALAIGFGQCLALWPGMSRSGATIITGLAAGLSRTAAAEFTFLLAVPTMSAAGLYELWKFRHALDASLAGLLAVGFIVSWAVAAAVVKWFLRFIQSHSFAGFAWYRIAAGAALLWAISEGWLGR